MQCWLSPLWLQQVASCWNNSPADQAQPSCLLASLWVCRYTLGACRGPPPTHVCNRDTSSEAVVCRAADRHRGCGRSLSACRGSLPYTCARKTPVQRLWCAELLTDTVAAGTHLVPAGGPSRSIRRNSRSACARLASEPLSLVYETVVGPRASKRWAAKSCIKIWYGGMTCEL